MQPQAFGYFGLGTSTSTTGVISAPAWSASGGRDHPLVTAFRMDDRKQRVIVDARCPKARVSWLGNDGCRGARRAGRAHLERAKVTVTREPAFLADALLPRTRGLISFSDPQETGWRPFIVPRSTARRSGPARNISGFRTGPLGLGHAVLTVKSLDAMMPFYTECSASS